MKTIKPSKRFPVILDTVLQRAKAGSNAFAVVVDGVKYQIIHREEQTTILVGKCGKINTDVIAAVLTIYKVASVNVSVGEKEVPYALRVSGPKWFTSEELLCMVGVGMGAALTLAGFAAGAAVMRSTD